MNISIEIPEEIVSQINELNQIVKRHPKSVPLMECAEFLGMDPESLKRNIELMRCPFALGWTSKEGSYRSCKIPTVTFWLWYTNNQSIGVLA